MPEPLNRLMIRLLIVTMPVDPLAKLKFSPCALPPAPAPFNSISGTLAKPPCVVPSSVTSRFELTVGSADVRLIVRSPVPILKLIICASFGAALTLKIACRKLPAPLSLAFETTNIAAFALVTSKPKAKKQNIAARKFFAPPAIGVIASPATGAKRSVCTALCYSLVLASL